MQQQKTAHWDQPNRIEQQAAVMRTQTDAEDAAGFVHALNKADVKSLFAHPPRQDKTVEDTCLTKPAVAPVEEALSLFDQLSTELTSSYRNLEQEVLQLKTELSAEEEQRQRQLREREALSRRMETLLDILPAGVVLLDGQGCVTECNPAALDLLGEPLEGQLWLDVITRCFAPKHDDGHEVSLKDGRRVRIETRSMNGEPGQLILLSDLTETRLLQEQVSRTERLSSLGKMVASLAHQIRTPLSTAMLYAGHLRQAHMEEDMRVECAEKLLSRLTHLEHQIRDMLIFAKGEARLAEDLNVAQFEQSLRSALEPVIAKAGAQCEWDISALDQHLLCNREALVGACLNIVNNSIEAYESDPSQEDELRLSVSISALESEATSATGASGLCITLTDNGPGIPDSCKAKLFEPFYTTKSQGTGLGLSVVQAVVKAHKGIFTLESGDSGVAARITLPSYRINKNSAAAAQA